MFDFYKPDWLYESLPYLYVAAGIATIAAMGHKLSLFSGGLLIMAGIHVWTMRRNSRKLDLNRLRPKSRR